MLALRHGCTSRSRRCFALSRNSRKNSAFSYFIGQHQIDAFEEAAVEHVPRILTALQQAHESVIAPANGLHGQLRIALSDGITRSRLPTLLALCKQEEPEVETDFLKSLVSSSPNGAQRFGVLRWAPTRRRTALDMAMR